MKKITISGREFNVERLTSGNIRVYFTENAYEEYEFSDWQNYGKHRVYVKKCGGKQIGYINMEDGTFSDRKTSYIADAAIRAYIEQSF